MAEEDEVVVTQKTLEILHNYQSVRIPRGDIELSTDWDLDFNQMIVRVSQDVAAEKLAEQYYTGHRSVSYPRSTWQMFKQTHKDSWWLGWLVRQCPVKKETEWVEMTVKVDRYLKYPDLKIPKPGMGRPLIHEIVKEVR